MVNPIRQGFFPTIGLMLILTPVTWTQPTLQGRVIDPTGMPIAGVEIELIGERLKVSTDSDGRYQFSSTLSLKSPTIATHFAPLVDRGNLQFYLEKNNEPVKLLLTDVQGRQKLLVSSDNFLQGRNSLDLQRYMQQELLPSHRILRLVVGERNYVIQGSSQGDGRQPEALAPLFKTAADADSLHFNKAGSEDAVMAVANRSAGKLPDVTLKRGVGFQQFFIGSGLVTNFATGKTVKIPKEEMYHVLYLPEGYTQKDIDAGRYLADVKSWYADVFSLDPLNSFKEAFVIWTLPVASAAHMGGDTYFKIEIGGHTGNQTHTTAKIWELLKRHPFSPKHFDGRARNWVVQFAIFDPARGRSGFSGFARSHANPANSRQSVSVAYALSQHHEFFHSFGRVADEYYDRGHGRVSFSSINNVTPGNKCEELPWKHLVYQGEFNKSTDKLVGAFGVDGRYHPEFKCLMNGSHHNADIFGGSNNLRVSDRLCNWCRELGIFRLFHGLGIIEQSANQAFSQWTSEYRRPFYETFKFKAPTQIPQTNSVGKEWFMPCVKSNT